MNSDNTFSANPTLTRDEIQTRVIPILAEEAGMEPSDMRESHLLSEIFDSLSTVEAVMQLEEEFDVDISDEAAEGMKTVGDVIDGMCRLLGA